jgi:hypothetical protein
MARRPNKADQTYRTITACAPAAAATEAQRNGHTPPIHPPAPTDAGAFSHNPSATITSAIVQITPTLNRTQRTMSDLHVRSTDPNHVQNTPGGTSFNIGQSRHKIQTATCGVPL